MGSWGIPSIFGTIEKSSSDGDKEHILNRGHSEPIQGSVESSYACIQLREVCLRLQAFWRFRARWRHLQCLVFRMSWSVCSSIFWFLTIIPFNKREFLCLLKQPPLVLRVNDVQTEHESVEISVTRLLLNSYYDIARKNIQDSVPKAIMHFLVRQPPSVKTLQITAYLFSGSITCVVISFLRF